MKNLVKLADQVGRFQDPWGLGWDEVLIRRSNHPKGQCREARRTVREAQRQVAAMQRRLEERIASTTTETASEGEPDEDRLAATEALLAEMQEQKDTVLEKAKAMKEAEAAAKIAGWSGPGFGGDVPQEGAFDDALVARAFFERWGEDEVLPSWRREDEEDLTQEDVKKIQVVRDTAKMEYDKAERAGRAAHAEAWGAAEDAYQEAVAAAGELPVFELVAKRDKKIRVRHAQALRRAGVARDEARREADEAFRKLIQEGLVARDQQIRDELELIGILSVPHGGRPVREAVADWILTCASDLEVTYRGQLDPLSKSSA